MADKPLKFALFGNEYQAQKTEVIHKVLTFLHDRKAVIHIHRPFYDYLMEKSLLPFTPASVFNGGNFDADFVISLGGDGTFLRAASKLEKNHVPLVGVNMGRLGFLADILPDEIEAAFTEIYNGQYDIERHTVLQVSAVGAEIEGKPFALNDVAVLKRDNSSMLTIRASVDGEYLVSYQADGLVVSTPTGSTAYNLSNGGPIIVPSANIICLTPMSPHSLNIRPIALNDNAVLSISVESRSGNFLVAIDGRTQVLPHTAELTIRKAPYALQTVKRRHKHYFSTLREKMMWGADQRG